MNKPHVHAAVIKAWADGADIEYRCSGRSWTLLTHKQPSWDTLFEYRVKPQQQERWVNIYASGGFISKEEAMLFAGKDSIACVKIVFTKGEGLE